MQTDYIIIGQGLCGSWLSQYLLEAGARVIVIDKGLDRSASSAASGVINPVTGKRLARQWMGDVMLPFARDAYVAMDVRLQRSVAEEVSIQTFFSTAEEAALFETKALAAEDDLLSTGGADDHFNYHYGIGTIHPALVVDVQAFLQGWRAQLSAAESLAETDWDWDDCRFDDAGLSYKGTRAKAVIDCTGAASAFNPFFTRLPFALNKGEALIASIPGLPRHAVYKHATLSIVPWGAADDFWIGSTFDWDFKDVLPTAAFLAKAEGILQQWLKLPFIIKKHVAAVRPATVTRDAFAGLHPGQPQVGILNGMGAKGCSLAPFLAHNLAQHLTQGTPLIAQVDIRRYQRVLGS